MSEPEEDKTIQRAFEQFHEANPWVYEALVRLARDLAGRGRTKIGMNMLWEVMRWESWRATNDSSSAYKLNDRYTSRYARLIQAQCPDLDGIFETRRLRAR